MPMHHITKAPLRAIGGGCSYHDFTRPGANVAAVTAGTFRLAESGICRHGAIAAAAAGMGRGLQWPRI